MTPNTFGLVVTILCLFEYIHCQNYEADHISSYDYTPDLEGKTEQAEDSGFVTPLDFSPLFGGSFGVNSAASNPVFQKLPKQYHSIFDTGESESRGISFFSGQSSDKQFSPESFGFIPTFSQGLASETVVQPKRYHEKLVEIERTKATAKSAAISRAPLQFNIETKHENTYKKQPDHNDDRPIDAYNSPAKSDYDVHHSKPQQYRAKNEDYLNPYKKYSFQAQAIPGAVPTYQALSSVPSYPFTQVPLVDPKLYRAKRYSNKKRNQKLRKAKQNKEEDEEEPHYGYLADYKSRPKEFDEGSSYETPDFSGYGDNAKNKGYDYGSDEEYHSDEYERIKGLSEQQAAEASKDPKNCKEVKKDSMTCRVCQNPKTGGSYESCSYVSEPKNNKYAYVKEQKYDSDDEPEEQEEESSKSESKEEPEDEEKLASIRSTPEPAKKSRGPAKYSYQSTKKPQKVIQALKYQPYYTQIQNVEPTASSEPEKFAAYKQQDEASDEEEEDDEEEEESNDKEYNYGSSIPDFFTDNDSKKNVEHVLAEFVKKDRSACKKVIKKGMTCYQCIDKTGLKHEECMFVSESAPKKSHLAYKEVKEFNSKPTTSVPISNEEAESKVVPTSNPAPSIETILSSTSFPTVSQFEALPKKKQLLKKYPSENTNEKKKGYLVAHPTLLTSGLQPSLYPEIPTIGTKTETPIKRHVKRRAVKEAKKKVAETKDPEVQVDETLLDNIAHPSEFAGEESKGAFWAETAPVYSKELGVTLPAYMLARSEHEQFFDEFLSSG